MRIIKASNNKLTRQGCRSNTVQGPYTSTAISKLLVVGCCLLLASCATSKPTNTSEYQAIQAQVEELRDRLDQQNTEWEQYRPGINRLTALESDFKNLIGQLDKMASSTPKPAPNKILPEVKDHKLMAVADAGDKAIKASAKKEKDAQPKTQQYALQVGTYRWLQYIESNKRKLVKKSPELLSDKRFYLTPVYIGPKKERLYRLLAGPVKDKVTAQALCRQLKTDGLDCMVRPLTGKPLSDEQNIAYMK